MTSNKRIFIYGGISYLGFNIIKWYSRHNDIAIYVVSRDKSVIKRLRLYKYLKVFPNVHVISYPNLSWRSIRDLILKYGCPDITYCLIGSIYGNIENLYFSNALLPSELIYHTLKLCHTTNVVHISSFYPSLSSKYDYVREEDPHLNNIFPTNHYEGSKAFGEYLLRKVYEKHGGKLIILRPGMIIGSFPYHIEWKALEMFSNFGISIYDNRVFPFSLAEDVARVAEFIFDRVSDSDNYFNWFYITPFNLTLSDFLTLFLDGRVRFRIKQIYTPKLIMPRKGLGEFIRSMLNYRGAYYIPHNLLQLNYKEGGSLYRSIKNLRIWLKNISLLDSLKPFFT